MRKAVSLVAVGNILATGALSTLDIRPYTRFADFLLLSKNIAGTSPTLDVKLQSSPPPVKNLVVGAVGATDNKLKTGATTNNKVGAVFTKSGTNSLATVDLMLKKLGTIAASQTVLVEVYADSAGAPTGSALATATLQIDTDIGTSYDYVRATFTKPVDLTDATVYHIVLTPSYTASSSNCVSWRSLTVASAGNLETFNNTTWTATTTEALELNTEVHVYTDITGGAFTQQVTALSSARQAITLPAETLGAFVRAYATIGGSASPSFYTTVECITEARLS